MQVLSLEPVLDIPKLLVYRYHAYMRAQYARTSPNQSYTFAWGDGE